MHDHRHAVAPCGKGRLWARFRRNAFTPCGTLTLLALFAGSGAGCQAPGSGLETPLVDRSRLRRESMACLKAALRRPDNPVVRVQAVEAMQVAGDPDAFIWIRTALLDEHPAVRFAGCLAVGTLQDHDALGTLRSLLHDTDDGVRLATSYALHQLGDTTHSGLMPEMLLENEDPAVRRNAALVLGLLGEPGAIKMLARAMKDPDLGVRHHVLEALARLGNKEAVQELLFMTNAGVGSEEVFALTALGNLRDPRLADTFAYKFANASHVETRLAAARGLGLLGDDRGFDLANRSLFQARARSNDRNDPPQEQLLRVRQMAAGALGPTGRLDALPNLRRMLHEDDPRLQVSAAKAILEILDADRVRALPYPVAPQAREVKGQ